MVKALDLSDAVREAALSKYVNPARKSGLSEFSIAIRDLSRDLDGTGFPRNHVPQICSAIQTKKFLREQNLEIVRVDGPASKLGTSVVVHYRVLRGDRGSAPESMSAPVNETPKEKAHRLVNKISGILREEIASYGGTEAFIRWVRSEG